MTALVIPKSVGGTGEEPEQKAKPEEREALSGLVIPKSVGGDADFDENPQEQTKSNSPLNIAAEFASAVNRGAVDVAEFLTTDQINAILQLSGSDKRVPGISGLPGINQATQGGFMDEGLAKSMTETSGEFVGAAALPGVAMRKAAAMIPETTKTLPNVIKSLASTPADDVVLSATGGAGAGAGEYTGVPGMDLLGSISASAITPFAISATKGMANKLAGALGIGERSANQIADAMTRQVDQVSDEIILDTLLREGITPQEAVKRFERLGPDAIPADIGEAFSSRLRGIANQQASIMGGAKKTLMRRKQGEPERISRTLDFATNTRGRDVDTEIKNLQDVLGPKIQKAYEKARSKPYEFSDNLKMILAGDNSMAKAQEKSMIRLADKEAVGDEIVSLDQVDVIKQELDDRIGVAIRQGEKHTVRDLFRLKQVLIDEVDEVVPEYARARDLFAGKEALETAAETGELFFKMPRSELTEYAKTLSKSEKEFYVLGAKKAILDKIDTINMTSNTARRLFGKNGDMAKLRALFPDEQSFKHFSRQIEREARYNMTRNELIGNSTTMKQAAEAQGLEDIVSAFTGLSVAASSPLGAAGQLQNILAKATKNKSVEISDRAFRKVGQFLIDVGTEPAELERLLFRVSDQELTRAIQEAVKKTKAEVMAESIRSSSKPYFMNEFLADQEG